MTVGALARRPGRPLDAAVVAVAVLVLAVCAPGAPAGAAAGVAAVLAAFLAVWFTAGHRALGGGRTWPAVAGALVAVCAAGVLVHPAFAWFQVIAYPLAWLVTPGLRWAVALNAAVALVVGAGSALGSPLLLVAATQGVSLAFSLAMGFWVEGIQRRSEERQQLIDRLTAAQAEVAALNREAGAVAERERLARELHDTLAQSLTGIVMLSERARARHPADGALGVLEDAARQAMTEARSLVAASAGVPLDGGLAAALHTLAERFRRETGLAVEVGVGVEVPRGLEVVLLRCAQEGLANVRKHADAGRVLVRVDPDGDEAVLTVADDGRGPGGGEGFGLAGMRDRLALVGGAARLERGADGGALLTVRVPTARQVPA